MEDEAPVRAADWLQFAFPRIEMLEEKPCQRFFVEQMQMLSHVSAYIHPSTLVVAKYKLSYAIHFKEDTKHR